MPSSSFGNGIAYQVLSFGNFVNRALKFISSQYGGDGCGQAQARSSNRHATLTARQPISSILRTQQITDDGKSDTLCAGRHPRCEPHLCAFCTCLSFYACNIRFYPVTTERPRSCGT